jgi:hypothetical protein
MVDTECVPVERAGSPASKADRQSATGGSGMMVAAVVSQVS